MFDEVLPSPGEKYISPEEGRLRDALIQNGYGDTIRAVDALRQIDTDALLEVAEGLYGIANNIVDAKISELRSGEVSTGISAAEAPSTIRRIRDDLEQRFYKASEEWHGDGQNGAAIYNGRLEDVTELEAFRSASLGSAVFKFAKAVEEAKKQSEETIIGSTNLLLAQVGFGASVASGGILGIVISAGSLLGAAVAEAQSAAEIHQAEVDATSAATVEINTPKQKAAARGLNPESLMPEFPDDVDEWEVE